MRSAWVNRFVKDSKKRVSEVRGQVQRARKTLNVLQCGTPLATYAHLALTEPIAHPGRGMPVLSSTVHIARLAFSKLGPDDFLLPFSCTSARCCGSAGLVACSWGRFFWQQDMPRPVPPRSPQKGQSSGATPLR